ACASNTRQTLSGDRAFILQKPIVISGESIKLTPPTKARLHSLCLRLWQARCNAKRDEEQAVSTCMVGPCKSRLYARRPAGTLRATPKLVYVLSSPGSGCPRVNCA